MTTPDLLDWQSSDSRFRRSDVSARIGHGDAVWERVTHDVLR